MTIRTPGAAAPSAELLAPGAAVSEIVQAFRSRLPYPWMAEKLELAYASKQEADGLVDQVGVAMPKANASERVRFTLSRRRQPADSIALDRPWRVQAGLIDEPGEPDIPAHEEPTAADALHFAGISFLGYGRSRSGQNVAALFRRIVRERTGINLFWRYSVDEPHMGVWVETLDAHFGEGGVVELGIWSGEAPDERLPSLDAHCQLALRDGREQHGRESMTVGQAIDAAAQFARHG